MERDDDREAAEQFARRLKQQQDAARDKHMDRDDRDDRQHQRYDKRQYERENR